MANSPFNLSLLNGTNGFILNGINAGDNSGISVSSAGDINGDGFDDLLVGASNADPGGRNAAGQTYVVFGGSNVGAGTGGRLNLSSLNGSNGFAINGVAPGDNLGFSVRSAGDINNDGFDDLIIGAFNADPGGRLNAGAAYVVLGGATVGAGGSLELSAIAAPDATGTSGFTVNGVVAGDNFGVSVGGIGDLQRIGDFNGDGIADFVIGAPNADPGTRANAGAVYVVYGRTQGPATPVFGPTLDLATLNGTNGFVINGATAGDNAGFAVNIVKDVNGDGLDDLVIGAPSADPDANRTNAGATYVVFGRTTPVQGGAINLSAIANSGGFVINGVAANDLSGRSVSGAGDVNGDGINDLIIGASNADPGGKADAGTSYVVFGGSTLGAGGVLELSTLNGINGFAINGVTAGDLSGISVSGIGDVNGDGIADLLIGAQNADPSGRTNAGTSYVVFGRSGIGAGGALELATIDGTTGIALNGINANDLSGRSVSGAGDVNGDGIADLIIGAPDADPNNRGAGGESYVVFGSTNFGTAPRPKIGPDFNNDGQTDILLRNTISGDIAMWYMNGTTLAGSALSLRLPDQTWQIQGTGDFNADNLTDILWRNSVTGDNAIWFMNNFNFLNVVMLIPERDVNWNIAGTGDFNSDGQTDFLWRHNQTGDNAVWLMNGHIVTQAIILNREADINWTIGGAADFNGDGETDILWRHSVTGHNAIWFMNDTTRTGAILIQREIDLAEQIVGVGDYNADGQADILWRNSQTGANSAWLMNGTTVAQDVAVTPLDPQLGWQIVA